MKRRILCVLLAVSMLTANAAAGFSDIEDNATQQAASALASMGIVTGNELGKYEPDRVLSRAEFTRLALSSLGIDNVDNYSSYTIFPDVPAGHWASGWVNAAVRHPDFEENPIIRGLGDGRFGPNNPTTLGEACTMALRMLGYEQKDIGPYWPYDYVAKARALGLLSNLTVTNPATAITRGEAAILFRNTLTTHNKEGKPMLSGLSGADPVTNSILVATHETDATLTASQATFYEGDFDPELSSDPDAEGGTEQKLKTRTLVGTIDPSVVGTHGTVIFDKDNPEAVRGFLPDQRTSREIVLERIEPEGLLANDGSGFVYIPRDTPLVVHGKIYAYGEGWVELAEGNTVTMHFDENGVIQVISATSSHLNFPIVIIGINGTWKSIPSGYKVELDGKRLRSAENLQLYDVVTLDTESRTALVSRKRITGRFDEASPSFRYPVWIKVLGSTYDIPQDFATSFKQMSPGDEITLLFDTYGRICGVTSDPRARITMQGVVTACTDTDVTVRLFNGGEVIGKIAPHQETDEYGEKIMVQGLERIAVGQQVRVSQNDDEEGSLNVVRIRTTQSEVENIGNWDIDNHLLGYRTVSRNVQVFEQVDRLVPMSQISINDIDMDIVPEEKIISYKEDSAGVVVAIFLTDVTGESWIYGMVNDTKIEIPEEVKIDPETGEEYVTNASYDFRVEMTTLIDGESVKKEFLLNHTLGKQQRRNQIIGLPASALKNQTRVTLTAKVPSKVGTAYLEDFEGYTSVKTKEGYYPIADDVPVYVKKFQRCITLRQAKASYSVFELYADRPINEGGKIRIILV